MSCLAGLILQRTLITDQKGYSTVGQVAKSTPSWITGHVSSQTWFILSSEFLIIICFIHLNFVRFIISFKFLSKEKPEKFVCVLGKVDQSVAKTLLVFGRTERKKMKSMNSQNECKHEVQ